MSKDKDETVKTLEEQRAASIELSKKIHNILVEHHDAGRTMTNLVLLWTISNLMADFLATQPNEADIAIAACNLHEQVVAASHAIMQERVEVDPAAPFGACNCEECSVCDEEGTKNDPDFDDDDFGGVPPSNAIN